MVLIFVALFGLIIGSFLNAVIYRLSVEKSALRGRSKCPDCGHVLRSADLVPVISFLLLRARCRYCKKPISWQYPLVECATALVFILIFLHFETSAALANSSILSAVLYAIYSAFLIIIFVYDLRHYLILDSVIIPASIVAIFGNLLLGFSPLSMIVGAIVAAGFFALQFYLSKGAWIGGGDIRLGALMGFMVGWPSVVLALMLAYVVGGIIGVGLILGGKKGLGSKLPFGTFLTVATFIVLLYGREILHWYWGLTYL